jgi:hypothetical protein
VARGFLAAALLTKAFWILVCFNLLFLVFSFVFYRDNIKTDFNQMNDNLNEKSIQNALLLTVHTVHFNQNQYNVLINCCQIFVALLHAVVHLNTEKNPNGLDISSTLAATSDIPHGSSQFAMES